MISPKDTCYIQDLYTAETVRGKGIGRALMQAVFDHARQLGAPGVYWHTHRSNVTAMQLYDDLAENTGFVVYRTKFGQPPA
jgi:GNAT superfamily N-acetyltransferase